MNNISIYIHNHFSNAHSHHIIAKYPTHFSDCSIWRSGFYIVNSFNSKKEVKTLFKRKLRTGKYKNKSILIFHFIFSTLSLILLWFQNIAFTTIEYSDRLVTPTHPIHYQRTKHSSRIMLFMEQDLVLFVALQYTHIASWVTKGQQ